MIKKVRKKGRSVQKEKEKTKSDNNSLIWNPSGNVESKRVQECAAKDEITKESVNRITRTILGENNQKKLSRNDRKKLFQETSVIL